MCQRNYGLFQATVRFPKGIRFIKGEPKYFKATGFARRGFCLDCGAVLLFAYEGRPDAWVLVGLLDHPESWPLISDATWGLSGHYHFDSRVTTSNRREFRSAVLVAQARRGYFPMSLGSSAMSAMPALLTCSTVNVMIVPSLNSASRRRRPWAFFRIRWAHLGNRRPVLHYRVFPPRIQCLETAGHRRSKCIFGSVAICG
jgi:hypothetical protein